MRLIGGRAGSCFLGLLLASAAFGQARPDDKLTPGKIRPELDTKAVCSTKWGKDERAVTDAMKAQVYSAYRLIPNRGSCRPIPHKNKQGKTIVPRSGCEVDHRVSRELAGADDIANLWPQPYLTPAWPGAYAKDRLENLLHRKVCAGEITLKEAQDALLGDWVAAYEKYIGALQACEIPGRLIPAKPGEPAHIVRDCRYDGPADTVNYW